MSGTGGGSEVGTDGARGLVNGHTTTMPTSKSRPAPTQGRAEGPAAVATAPAASHRAATRISRILSEAIFFQSPVERRARETQRARGRAEIAFSLCHRRHHRRAFLNRERLHLAGRLFGSCDRGR